MFALEVHIPSIDSPTSPDAATKLLQCLRDFAIESAEASLEEVTGDRDSKLYQLLEPHQYPIDNETVEDAINRYFDYLQENIETCYAGHYETVLVGFYAAKLMGFPAGSCIPVYILEYPTKKPTRNTTFPSYGDAKPMQWGVRQIGECNGTDVPPMVFSYSHVDAKNRQGHFDVVAIANETMTYSQLARVKSFFRELNHSLKTRTPTPSSPKLKRKTNSPKSPSSKRRSNDDDDVASETATELQEAETMFDLKVFFKKSGNIEPRDFSETKQQVMKMLGGSVKARELLKHGTLEVALFNSEILTTRWVDTTGMYGDYILLENYYKLPDAAASSSPGSISIFRHVGSQLHSTNHKLIAFASSESLRTLMEPCEVIKNGERAAIMAVLDDTAYDYVQQFSQVPLVRLV
tara:strand:+ start:732 stop:1949 length:1218 start_codon:yes stop_codon:yes gene_type:complete